jgi:hypothetical protein
MSKSCVEITKENGSENQSVAANATDNEKKERPVPAPTAQQASDLRMKSALEVYAQQQATLTERLASISSSLKVWKKLLFASLSSQICTHRKFHGQNTHSLHAFAVSRILASTSGVRTS